jgi:glycosyltransferase 2 family protein
MKKWFNYFVYVSIVSLLIALITADYIIIPKVHNYNLLVLSVLFVCFGFFLDSLAWKKTLHVYGYKNVKTKQAVSSMGLSIFGKYIPGKIWLIMGRSAYLAKIYNINEKDTTSISLNAQFISLWVGLLIGVVGFIFIGTKLLWAALTLLLWVVLSLILFSRVFHNLTTFLIGKILKKTIVIPSLSVKKVFEVMPWFILNWILWCAGFYFLAQSLSPTFVSPFSGFLFALAGTLGLLAVFAPGGLGIREGIIVTMLIMAGLNEELAISISVASRLWFLIGEMFIFVLALILKTLHERENKKI